MNELHGSEKYITGIDVSLETLLDLPQACIYALVNEVDMKVSVYGTRDLIGSLGRYIKDCKYGSNGVVTRDSGKVKIVILETEFDKVLLDRHIVRYKQLGYVMYNDVVSHEYKLLPSIRICRNVAKYYLYIVSNTNNRILVGIFDSYNDMNTFISNEYSNNVINKIVKHESCNKRNKDSNFRSLKK